MTTRHPWGWFEYITQRGKSTDTGLDVFIDCTLLCDLGEDTPGVVGVGPGHVDALCRRGNWISCIEVTPTRITDESEWNATTLDLKLHVDSDHDA